MNFPAWNQEKAWEMLMITVNIFTLVVELRTSGGRKEIKADFITEHASKSLCSTPYKNI